MEAVFGESAVGEAPQKRMGQPGVPLLALCQYRLGETDPEDTMEILERHP